MKRSRCEKVCPGLLTSSASKRHLKMRVQRSVCNAAQDIEHNALIRNLVSTNIISEHSVKVWAIVLIIIIIIRYIIRLSDAVAGVYPNAALALNP